MSASDRAGYSPSWYTATALPVPERAPLTTDLDVDVCVVGGGPRRADHRARDRPRRLVGGGAGGRPHRRQRVRAQLRLRAAGLCGERRHHRGAGGAAEGAGIVGAGGGRPRICPRHHPRNRHAGRRSDRRLAQRLQAGRCRPHHRDAAAARPGPRRRGRGLGERAGARRAQERPLFQRAAFPARLSSASAQLRARSGGSGPSGRRAHLRANPGGGHRSGRGAQAHRDAAWPRSGRPMWCSPAMSASAR